MNIAAGAPRRSFDMSDVVIVSAVRTPVGSFNGALASLPAHELGKVAIQAAIERAGITPADVEEVVMGQVLQAAAGQGPPARPRWPPAFRRRPRLEPQPALRLGPARRGARPPSRSPTARCRYRRRRRPGKHEPVAARAHLRNGTKMGDTKFIDTMIKDGLWDAFHGYHMGQTAENVATKWQISREEQDAFAVEIQNKAEAAQKAGRFKDEIVPFTIKGRKGDTIVDQDEYPRRRHRRGDGRACAPPSTRRAP
jgi:acetyl-CoA C-acetyltransferase